MNKEFSDFTHHLASISGKIIKQYFRTEISVDSKSDLSPVTNADKKSEEVMREEIMRQFPDHGIIGEEFGNQNSNAEYVWVLDPIDGTKSFICGAPTFGTLIALMRNNEPVLGAINHPVLNEFLIGDNSEARLNGQKTAVRKCSSLNDAVLITGDHFNIGKFQNQHKFDDLAKRVKLYRHWGDCFGYYLLATGFVDIVIDPVMSVWDSMALIPIVRGAGGVISDYQGNNPVTGNSIIASSPEIHSDIIRSLN
ncbi:MAG: histidinol-phosphatase [Ignavibacteriaceae bacterium]